MHEYSNISFDWLNSLGDCKNMQCSVFMHIEKIKNEYNESEKDKSREVYVYPEDIELDGYKMFVNLQLGVNHKQLFREKEIIDRDRWLRGEPWIRINVLRKWAKKIQGRKMVKAFNSKGWIKRKLGGGHMVDRGKLMLLFVKNDII